MSPSKRSTRTWCLSACLSDHSPLLDTVGLDIALDVARILHRSYGPQDGAGTTALEAFVKAGRMGLKTGRVL